MVLEVVHGGHGEVWWSWKLWWSGVGVVVLGRYSGLLGGGVVYGRRGGLMVSVPVSTSPVPGSNLGPGPPHRAV